MFFTSISIMCVIEMYGHLNSYACGYMLMVKMCINVKKKQVFYQKDQNESGGLQHLNKCHRKREKRTKVTGPRTMPFAFSHCCFVCQINCVLYILSHFPCHSHLCTSSYRSGIQKVISVHSPGHQVLENYHEDKTSHLKTTVHNCFLFTPSHQTQLTLRPLTLLTHNRTHIESSSCRFQK